MGIRGGIDRALEAAERFEECTLEGRLSGYNIHFSLKSNQKAIAKLFGNANEEIDILVNRPYPEEFIDSRIIEAAGRALERGVRFKIIVPSNDTDAMPEIRELRRQYEGQIHVRRHPSYSINLMIADASRLRIEYVPTPREPFKALTYKDKTLVRSMKSRFEEDFERARPLEYAPTT